MRSLSSIIKSGRARDQGIMNLSDRQNGKRIEEVHNDMMAMEGHSHHDEQMHVTSSDIEEKKEELLRVQCEIDRMIAESKQQAEAIINSAYAKASEIETDSIAMKEQMLLEVAEKEKQLLEGAQTRASEITNAAFEEKMQMLGQVEGEVVETMITILQHIMSEEVTYNRDWLYYIVKRMLQKPDVEEGVALLISADLYESLENKYKEKLLTLRKLSDIKVDESLNDTTCKLVTSQGSIEYDVQQGLDKMISELRIMKSLSRSQDDRY